MTTKKWVVGGLAAILVASFAALFFYGPNHDAKPSKGPGADQTVAVVRVEGVISDASTGTVLATPGSGRQILETLRQLRDDSSIKAVVLRINSPGGTSAASQELGEELAKVRQSGKVVVASMGEMATSGGYWLAAKCDKIVALPTTTTGSIGVRIDYANLQELYKKIGYRPGVIKSGPYKDILSTDRELTPEELAIVQALVNDTYEQFLDVVADGRKMTKDQVRTLADGRIYTGRQALNVGLVDELGTFYDAVDRAAQLAGIEGEPVIEEYGNISTLEKLLGSMGAQSKLQQAVTPADFLRWLQVDQGKPALP
ncbi:signal peptide peptidase SppA [Heliophilum fasciatum]|uniref:Signal peptide peptidase A n=1 Tax=Heliophilum fasciatum TaxID=35700 RepID=A0A4V2SX96_9FIRM|nr:signal peptide peptidase SppA [Heliophilum fasciatum]MCW2277503.1 protease-4 [Heliophilum fasciatum]TCP65206.1 signal peptide peptidase A [Heliophilum fasciatum]